MNIRYDIGYQPPRSAYIGDGPIPTWEINDVPDFYRYADEALEHSQKMQNTATSFTELIKGIGGSIPFIGSLFNAIGNIALNGWNRGNVEIANARRRLESRYADWYNSPLQQLKRARKAGINPFMQSYVKSLPHEMPDVETVPYHPFNLNTESLAGLINAFTNAKVAESRIDNLDSLTAINQYKNDYLLPQLFVRNGYLNNIMELQSAWEEKNYDKERQVKQNILNAQYELALIDTAQGIMENSAQIPGSYIKVDPVAGTLEVQIPDENGNMNSYGLHELPFDKLPPHLQKILTDVWSERTMTNSKAQLNTIIGNTQSALGGLYNANREKVEIYVKEWENFKVWPDADPVLRAATGSLDWSNLWKITGYNTANRAINTAMDIGAAFANPKYLLGGGNPTSYPYGQIPMSSPIQPQPLNIPRGAKPYTVNGQTFWYYPK